MQAGQQGELQGEGRQPVGGELHLPYKGYWNLGSPSKKKCEKFHTWELDRVIFHPNFNKKLNK